MTVIEGVRTKNETVINNIVYKTNQSEVIVMNRIFDEKDGKFLNRLNNLKINGEYSDFLYMGTMESTYHNAWLSDEDGCKDLGRLFDIEKSERVNPCAKCKNFDICDDKVSDRDGGFIVEPDIVQDIVYYNYKCNSAVIFSVYIDSAEEHFGFEKVSDLIDEIYSGGNSVFMELSEDVDFAKALFEKDNIVYVHYSYGNVINDIYHLDLHHGSLKGVDVRSMIDILMAVN